jgi:hypothetical protein
MSCCEHNRAELTAATGADLTWVLQLGVVLCVSFNRPFLMYCNVRQSAAVMWDPGYLLVDARALLS